VQLCCGIFDAGRFTIGNYLEMPLDHIQKVRRQHAICAVCTQAGVNVYVTYGLHELEKLAAAAVDPEDALLLDLRYELAQKRLRRKLEMLYEKLFAGVITTEQKAALGSLFNRVHSFIGRAKSSPKDFTK